MHLKTSRKNKNFTIKRTVIILFLLIPHCSAHNSFSLKSSRRTGSKEILNYEYTNDYYIHEIRRNHFLLSIEIDKPVIVESGSVNMDTIYPAAGIRGEAILHFRTDKTGKVTGYRFRKRAGLGMDRFVVKLIKNIKIKPVSHRGSTGDSEFIAKFTFRPHEIF
jgi:hypothetical protein